MSFNDTPPLASVVPHGEALSVECESQYEFIYSQTPVTCNNGTWTQIPRCEPARLDLRCFFLIIFYG